MKITKQVARKVFNGAYSIITNKDDSQLVSVTIANTRAIDFQEKEIRMGINLPYVEGTNEKLLRILRSLKIRSTFCSENTLEKLLCKAKDRVAT